MSRGSNTLEIATLGLLQEAPLHGYELRKRLNLLLGWGRVLSYGSLYPTLKKMLREGLISEVHQRSNTLGRKKITYQITNQGSSSFTNQLADFGPNNWEDEHFGIRFAFFSRTESGVRLRILEGRRTRLEERLDRIKKTTYSRPDRYTSEWQRHSIESMERELTWLTGLIEAERQNRELPSPKRSNKPENNNN